MFNNRMCSLIFVASKSSLSSSKHCFYSNTMITYYLIRIIVHYEKKWDVWCHYKVLVTVCGCWRVWRPCWPVPVQLCPDQLYPRLTPVPPEWHSYCCHERPQEPTAATHTTSGPGSWRVLRREGWAWLRCFEAHELWSQDLGQFSSTRLKWGASAQQSW